MSTRRLPPVRSALAAAVLLLAASPAAAAPGDKPAPAVKVDVGQIAGARFAIASPPGDWNHRLVLIAHGYRPVSAPLVADLHPEREPNRSLLEAGWMVATTSFRRNGVVVADAMADLDALRAHIAQAYGDLDRVMLEGESLGGLIVTIMAERDKGPYDGAVAFDATLYAKEANSTVGISLMPRIPLLFVATFREAAASKAYLTALVARPDPVVQPALFLVSRMGHNNISQAERLVALRALDAWIERGRDALPQPQEQARYFDATVAPDPGPSTAVVHPDRRGFDTKVAEVDEVYGNVLLEAQDRDFADAGIPPMTYCTVRAGNAAYRTLYGRTYTDVRDGLWVAFPDADGRTVLSRVLADAAGTANLKVGDTVSVEGVEPGGPPSR
jgi:hypothetical protein